MSRWKNPRQQREHRREAERAGIERMREMLTTGLWPSGLGLSTADRRVVEHNIEVATAHLETLADNDGAGTDQE